MSYQAKLYHECKSYFTKNQINPSFFFSRIFPSTLASTKSWICLLRCSNHFRIIDCRLREHLLIWAGWDLQIYLLSIFLLTIFENQAYLILLDKFKICRSIIKSLNFNILSFDFNLLILVLSVRFILSRFFDGSEVAFEVSSTLEHWRLSKPQYLSHIGRNASC